MDIVCSEVLEVTSEVPQGSVLGLLLFCLFMNDLSRCAFLCSVYLFADDLKLLSLANIFWNFQDNLHAAEKWVMQNKMDLAMEKCSQISFQDVSNEMKLLGGKFDSEQAIEVLGVKLQKDLSWRLHVNTRIYKPNQVLFLLGRNVHAKFRISVKLGVYKSLVLPVLLFGFNCVSPSSRDLNELQRFQRNVLEWITGK